MVSVYPELIGAIARRGLNKSTIAREVGISPRTLYAKLTGQTDFTLSEANAIQRKFFPDMEKDVLFQKADEGQDSA